MARDRMVLLAATTVVVAAAGAFAFVRSEASAAVPAPTETEARILIGKYRADAAAGMSRDIRYNEAVSTIGVCADPPGTYTISSRYSLMPPSAADGAAAIDALRKHWADLGYRVVTDTPGQNSQLLTEDPASGFRLGIRCCWRRPRKITSRPSRDPGPAPPGPWRRASRTRSGTAIPSCARCRGRGAPG